MASICLLPSQIKQNPSYLLDQNKKSNFLIRRQKQPHTRRKQSIIPVARLFGPSIFEASKLKVLFVGVDEGVKGPAELPRAYTLTHSDITSKITLAVSNNIHQPQLQGWYNRLQRDEVVAEWKKVKGNMSLHVHCHISGGHFLLDLVASLRYYIFSKELPMVLKAFVYGDESLFHSYPQLEEALVWVYFHSNIPEFNRVECWGPLRDASSIGRHAYNNSDDGKELFPQPQCQIECDCCFPTHGLVQWSGDNDPRCEENQTQFTLKRHPRQEQFRLDPEIIYNLYDVPTCFLLLIHK